jgi:hypothetical protein
MRPLSYVHNTYIFISCAPSPLALYRGHFGTVQYIIAKCPTQSVLPAAPLEPLVGYTIGNQVDRIMDEIGFISPVQHVPSAFGA